MYSSWTTHAQCRYWCEKNLMNKNNHVFQGLCGHTVHMHCTVWYLWNSIAAGKNTVALITHKRQVMDKLTDKRSTFYVEALYIVGYTYQARLSANKEPCRCTTQHYLIWQIETALNITCTQNMSSYSCIPVMCRNLCLHAQTTTHFLVYYSSTV